MANWQDDKPKGVAAKSRAEARIRKLKTYEGGECKVHKGCFTRRTSNGACLICLTEWADKSTKVRGYVAKRTDKLAFRHPVSPWPINADNLSRCPNLSPKLST